MCGSKSGGALVLLDGKKAVILDLDGVLLPESEGVLDRALRQVFFKEFKVTLVDADVNEVLGKPISGCMPRLLKKYDLPRKFPRVTTEQVKQEYEDLWEAMVTVSPTIVWTIRHLYAFPRRLAIATTNRRDKVRWFFDQSGLKGCFEFALTGEDVSAHKPDPQIYNMARLRFDLPEREVIAVEDSDIGIEAAQKAGIECVAVRNRFNRGQSLKDAKHRLANLQELFVV